MFIFKTQNPVMNKLDPSNRNPLVEPKLAQPILHSFQLILGITIGQCNIH